MSVLLMLAALKLDAHTHLLNATTAIIVPLNNVFSAIAPGLADAYTLPSLVMTTMHVQRILAIHAVDANIVALIAMMITNVQQIHAILKLDARTPLSAAMTMIYVLPTLVVPLMDVNILPLCVTIAISVPMTIATALKDVCILL